MEKEVPLRTLRRSQVVVESSQKIHLRSVSGELRHANALRNFSHVNRYGHGV